MTQSKQHTSAELATFRAHLSHQVMQAAFTFGPRSPMAQQVTRGHQIYKIDCTVEADRMTYTFIYDEAGGVVKAVEEVYPTADDAVQKYVCQRFNVMLFGQSVEEHASVTIDGIEVDDHFEKLLDDGVIRNFFRETVVRDRTEKTIN